MLEEGSVWKSSRCPKGSAETYTALLYLLEVLVQFHF
jgi:hypothetical protein